MGMLQEFKEFAMKGNVVDLAVGVIIGAAFGAVVTSLVENVMMPPLGYIIGKVDFSQLAINLPTDEEPVEIKYGLFINALIKFLIQAFAVFLVVKVMNKMMKEKEEAPKEPELSTEEKLLTEIRDALKGNTGPGTEPIGPSS